MSAELLIQPVGTAVIGAVTSVLVTNALRLFPLRVIPSERKKAMAGVWTGITTNVVTADEPPSPVGSFPLTMNIVAGPLRLSGTMEFTIDGQRYVAKLRGRFITETLLRLDYRHQTHIIGFGSMIFELHPNHHKMRGKLAGYGARSERLILAKLDVEKA
jgi:hypothetical protein